MDIGLPKNVKLKSVKILQCLSHPGPDIDIILIMMHVHAEISRSISKYYIVVYVAVLGVGKV